MAFKDNIFLKKKFGQHFLTQSWVVDEAIKRVSLDKHSYVLEIGGGAGFLTRAILEQKIARLRVYEIDPEWAKYLQDNLAQELALERLEVIQQDFMQLDFQALQAQAPWTVLANLPYNVSFPIIERFVRHREFFKEGVVMVQEEVAQKIVKRSGRGYGAISLFFQYYCDWELLSKIPPTAFNPPPKVFSRLIYFKPKLQVAPINDELNFWKFARMCFKFPRRTMRNNLAQTHYIWQNLPEEILALRAQQMDIDQFLAIWDKIR
jgi:16S rRNA (adenine1518-N6/adenine1519-N6)-dimethyltransferase